MKIALDKKGFTLIEIMIAVVIASFGLMALTNVYGWGSRASQYAMDYTKAVLLAKQKIEEFRLTPKDRLESKVMAFRAPTEFKDYQGNPINPGFRWSAAIVNRWQGLIEVEVDVSWQRPNGDGRANYQVKSVKLSSYF